MSRGSTSVIAPRATPTASAQTWSRRAARAVVLVVTVSIVPHREPATGERLPQMAAPRTRRGSPRSVRMGAMPLLPTIGRTVGTGIKAVRLLVRGSVRGGAWATRRVGSARARGAANEIGMIRLFDLHAISCAGDTLIAIGLAGTIFFNVPLGEARSKVALYLLITMVPFALLAPVVGPLLDHFRHGRRYALAATMLGRAFLAYVISDHLLGWGLYPAAFGVLALSRAYGVARSAAVPRLLPEGIGLSQVGARASVYGTFAGAVVAPIGLLAFKFGPQWPLRVASIIFLVGMVDLAAPAAARRLRPARGGAPAVAGHAAPGPRRRPAALRQAGRRHPDRQRQPAPALRLPAALPDLRDHGRAQLDTDRVRHATSGRRARSAVVGGALAVGTFLSTAIGTRLRIRRPLALQSAGLTITAGVAVLAALFYNLADGGAARPGHGDLQRHRQAGHRREHPGTRARAAAGQRLRPLRDGADDRLGGRRRARHHPAARPAGGRAGRAARGRLRRYAPRSSPPGCTTNGSVDARTAPPPPTPRRLARNRRSRILARRRPADPWPDAPTVPTPNRSAAPAPRSAPRSAAGARGDEPRGDEPPSSPRRAARTTTVGATLDATVVETASGRNRWFGRRKGKAPAHPTETPGPAPTAPEPATAPTAPDAALAPPGYHVYRPTSSAERRPPATDGDPVEDDDR